MKYRSTRGSVANLAFKDSVVMGLADDGGLLVPETIPNVAAELPGWEGLTFSDLAFEIISRFVGDIPEPDLRQLVEASYAVFDDPRVTPVRQLGDLSVLELFHGPTLAFKDIALQFLGNVFEYILEQRDTEVNILGATSGDTGSAAIAGVRGKQNIQIYIMFPEGRTSPIQERQMTTVLDSNVHNIAIRGSFDDCQSLMKAVFSDLHFKQEFGLAAVNSVNWARVLAQIVYYFAAWYQMGRPGVFDVAVPTGNFGNIFAGYMARNMGLPIRRLILATNQNDILCRFFETGVYRRGDVHFTLSPAMDIQVASNFERYLFYQLGENPERTSTFMKAVFTDGAARLNFNTQRFDNSFITGAANDEATLETIRNIYRKDGYLVDPHTAVGITVGRRFRDADTPLLCLATAHPAKFDEAMHKALPGVRMTHPSLEVLSGLPSRKTVLEPEVGVIKQFIRAGGAAG